MMASVGIYGEYQKNLNKSTNATCNFSAAYSMNLFY